MKKSVVGLSLFLALGLLIGCSNEQKQQAKTEQTTTDEKSMLEYNSALAKGKEAIVDKDMSKAISAFQLALEYKKDSQEAASLIQQAKLYQEALVLKEKKDYSEALKKGLALHEFKKGSDLFKQYAKEIVAEIDQEMNRLLEASKKAKESAETAKEPKTEEKKAAAPVETKEKIPKTHWNGQKSAELAAFMLSWGQTMGQNYLSYYPGEEVNFYGVHYPSELIYNNLAIDGNLVNVQWSEDGMAQNIYNIVAIYSDIDTSAPKKVMGNHLYLFAIYNGQPVVLITMQNQGNSENLVYFKQTENQELKNGFTAIVSN